MILWVRIHTSKNIKQNTPINKLQQIKASIELEKI